MDKNRGVYIILIVILIVASVLRLLHPTTIPYTYDELSALARTHYTNFSDLINKGVMLDAHPAGIQVFLYYWVKCFGYNELVVKIPFIICGILAVYFTFLLANRWFNSTVGLVCAAYVATLQYTIMYSQVARPYITGMLFVLLMVYYWDKFIASEKRFDMNAVLYVLFSACCAYNHHFSLLFVFIVGNTGLFLVRGNKLFAYVTACVCIFLLYIPHIHIFLYQLHVGGVGGANGWLGPPDSSFIVKYAEFIGHYSWTVLSVTVCIFLLSIWGLKQTNMRIRKYSLLSLCWFAIPFAAGYFYSVYVNPVLQYSVLIFSFPFMLFCLFGWLPEMKNLNKALIVTFVAVTNIVSLVYGRQYYNVAYKNPHEQSIVLTDSVMKSLGKANCLSIIQSDDSVKNSSTVYIKKYKADTSSFFWLDSDSLQCFTTRKNNYNKLIYFLEHHKRKYLSLGCTAQIDPIVMPTIMDFYPYLVKKWNYYDGNFYLFTKDSTMGKPYPETYKSVNGFEGKAEEHWDESTMTITDTFAFAGKHSYRFDSLHEWGPSFICNLHDIVKNKNDFLDVSVELYPLETLKDVDLVVSIDCDGKQIHWTAIKATDFMPDNYTKQWRTVRMTIRLSDIDIRNPHTTVKAYMWNQGKRNFFIDNFEIRLLEGNPIIYALFEKI